MKKMILVLILSLLASFASAGVSSTEITNSAKELDSIVQRVQSSNSQIKIYPVINDQLFLRRAFLDIAGRIPTTEETISFLNSQDKEKRNKLVSQLLNSQAYVQNYFNFWSDLLRIKSRLNNNVNGQPYADLTKKFINEDIPYNQFVKELLTANGRIMDNPATGYYLRDLGMPLDNMSNTTQVFLGTSITCAQCHDHPFDKWTQLEFYQLSAYTYGMEYREKLNVNQRELYAKARDLGNRTEQMIRNIIRINSYGISDTTKTLKLPDDYKYDDARPGEAVKPLTIFGSNANGKTGDELRAAFATWLTDSKNPRFTTNIVNRLWKKVYGIPIIDPVDAITDESKPLDPELLSFLEEKMREYNYSIRSFLTLLYSTQTYQAGFMPNDLSVDDVYLMQGRLVKRMTSEQMWDSFVTLVVGVNVDRYESESAFQNYYESIDIKGKNTEQIIELAKQLTENPKKSPSLPKKQVATRQKETGIFGLTRAASSPLPANPGSFLRDFGQSDKESIDAFSTDPSVIQVLRLMNGDINRILLDKRTDLMVKIEKEKQTADKINIIFLSILNRYPNQNEMKLGLNQISANKEKGIGNIIWALLNGREWMMIR